MSKLKWECPLLHTLSSPDAGKKIFWWQIHIFKRFIDFWRSSSVILQVQDQLFFWVREGKTNKQTFTFEIMCPLLYGGERFPVSETLITEAEDIITSIMRLFLQPEFPLRKENKKSYKKICLEPEHWVSVCRITDQCNQEQKFARDSTQK